MQVFLRVKRRPPSKPSCKPSQVAAVLVSVLMLAATGVTRAQGFIDPVDWKEIDVAPPPAFDMAKLVTFDVTLNSALTYGVDPASVTISKVDGVVRYVLVAYSASGAKNVMYDGLRCSTGEVKTYARYMPDGRWVPVTDPQWRSVFDTTTAKHSLRLARAGVCVAGAPVGTVKELVAKLKSPPLKFAD